MSAQADAASGQRPAADSAWAVSMSAGRDAMGPASYHGPMPAVSTQRSAPAKRPAQPAWLLLAAVGVPPAVGVALGWLADATTVSALLLLAEPLLFAIGVYVAALLAVQGRLRTALCLVLGLFLGGAGARIPPEPRTPQEGPASLAEELSRCAGYPDGDPGALRVLSWRLDAQAAQAVDPMLLLQQHPDVIVLIGTSDERLGAEIAGLVQGEARFVPPMDGRDGTTIVSRGTFRACGSDDLWAVPLSATDPTAGGLAMAFPHIDGVGLIPLVIVQIDGPGAPRRWGTWPNRLTEAGDRIATLVDALDARRTVVVGDFGAPPTFRHLAGALEGAELREVAVPPTWPSQAGPLPFLPLHALHRAWIGPGWSSGAAWTLRIGDQPHQPLVVDFAPATMRAGSTR